MYLLSKLLKYRNKLYLEEVLALIPPVWSYFIVDLTCKTRNN